MPSPIASVFQRVSSFFAPPPSYTEPFVPPVISQTVSFDLVLKGHLDSELDAYMSGRHMCNICDNCWKTHKKTAGKLLKLHPLTYTGFE